MRKLVNGYRRFHSHVFPQKRTLYSELAEGQKPRYLFITCADSRVDPLDFTGTNAGDMFMERSLGNIVPLPETGELESTSTIEYAVEALGVQHVIVCGHSQCGAMKALLNPSSLDHLPTVKKWLKGAAATLEAVRQNHPELTGDELLDATIRENVIVQVANVKKQPCVGPRLLDGRLQVHGWVFEIDRGRVVALDPKTGTFVPLTQAYPAGETW